MKQYLDLLATVLEEGVWKDPAREGLPRTKEVFGMSFKHDLSEGFPLLTTKKMPFKTILTELLWFLKGDTNIHYLLENKVNIWNDNGYEFFKRNHPDLNWDKEQWLQLCKEEECLFGDLGRIYGAQWRSYRGENFQNVDQVARVFETLSENKNSRYAIINGWDPYEFLVRKQAALPVCHMTYIFNVQGDKLNVQLLQRSCDCFLGVPFNIAELALIDIIFARWLNLKPGFIHWVGGSCHIYENHIEQVQLQLTRTPTKLPFVEFDVIFDDPADLHQDDFNLVGYLPQDKIQAEMSAGKY